VVDLTQSEEDAPSAIPSAVDTADIEDEISAK